jgi:hypothetical protein
MSVIRYAASVRPTMGGGAEWHPDHFSAQHELDSYDCFLLHSARDRSIETFRKRLPEVKLVFHEQSWWAYLTRRSIESHRGSLPEVGDHGSALANCD